MPICLKLKKVLSNSTLPACFLPWVRRILEKDSFVTWYHLCRLYNDVNQFVLLASINLLVALLKAVHTEILGGCTYVLYSAS